MAKVRILGHPGHGKPRESGVQTSEGDKFHGEIVDLPKDEAKMLVAMGRAKHFEDEEKPTK